MSDQVDDWNKRYEKWDEQWTQQELFILKDKNIVPYEIKEKKVILCGVPNAFTPDCTNRHLPGICR